MKQAYSNNYRNLIAALLIYPHRASKILDANQEMCNSSLVQAIEQVADEIEANGSYEAADFLQNLAEQLKEVVVTIEEKIISDAGLQIIESKKTNNLKLSRHGIIISLSALLMVIINQQQSTLSQKASVDQTDANQLHIHESVSPATHTFIDTVANVAALGYLEPQGEVIQLSAPAFMEGARVEQLLVKRGDKVKAGQIVAILDSRDRLMAALEQAQAQAKVAASRLTQVNAGAKQGEIEAQKARFQRIKAELEGQITTQRANIATLKAQLIGETRAQEATIKRIEAELNNSQTNCGRYEYLLQNGAVSASQRDDVCLQQETTTETLEEAQANLNRIITSRQEQIKEAVANLNRTVATVQRQIKEAQANLDAVGEVRQVDVQVATGELKSAQANVKRAQADLNLAYVRSSQDGQVIKIYTRPGELINNEGIVTIGQTDQMYVTAEIYETDISQVHVGQKATVKADGVVKELKGTVDEIGLEIGRKNVLGTDPVADADARVVEVKIRLTPEDSQKVASFTNLQVKVIINTSKQK